MVRKRYMSAASSVTSSEACSRGLSALQYLQWLFTAVEVDGVATSYNVVRLPSLSADIQAEYVSALNSVTCDGATLLITWPTIWQVSSGFSTGAGSLCLLAASLCLCCIVYVFVYRSHPVIRSSSPHFVSTSLLGVCVLLCGTYVMLQPASSATCSAMAWLWSFGFSLTFAPLFAKTWRIYRIFGRKKLSVVKIGNNRLATLVLAILTLDVLLMAVWQAVSPLQPYVTTQYTGSSPVVQTDYTQCGVGGSGRSLLALVAVSKAVLLMFGALMAFTTRKVSSTFNESSGIALAIYNVLFSIGIIAPIIVVIGAIGDVLLLLLLFLGAWVSVFTAAILFVPKLLHIHGQSGQQANQAADMSKVSSSGQYSFLSMAQLSTVPIVMAYVAALKSHLSVAEKRLADLKASKQRTADGGSGSGGNSRNNVAAENSTSQRRATLSQQRDAQSPSTGTQGRSLLTDAHGNDGHEVDVLTPQSQPPNKQRTTIVTQASPLLREKRPVGRSSRADGGGEGELGDGRRSPVQGEIVRGSSASEQNDSGYEEVEQDETSMTKAAVGVV